MHLTTSGIDYTNGITITSDGRVGIGVVEPEEDLELDGNIQLDTGGVQRGRVIFYDKQNDHEHAEVDGLGDGTNGGVLAFYTKVDDGSVTEKLRINNQGAIGIGGTNYGTAGDVIISNGSGSSVSWRTPVILGASLTNSSYTGANPRSVVIYDNVEFETVSCYNTSTGVFTAPRTAYYMVNAYARVTDFIAPFGARPLSYIYKKVGGTFTLYSVADFVDENENLKVATPRTNIIINLNSGEEIRHEVTFPSNSSFTYAIRGDAFEIRCSYLSIHSIN